MDKLFFDKYIITNKIWISW